MRSNNAKLNYLSFEPIYVKKSDISAMKTGDILELGHKFPKLYVYRKGKVIGQARLGVVDKNISVVISAKERIVDIDKAESKSVIMEARLAVMPKDKFVVSKLVQIPSASIEKIMLFVKKRAIATAKLVTNNKNFALQITDIL